MIRNCAGLLAVWVLLPLLVAAAKAAGERLGLSGEHKRKIVHVGMGLASLAFPWLFSSWVWVAVLCAGCLLQLGWVRRQERRTGSASALHDIERHSLGEICFPVSVVLVFALSGGVLWRYLIPILVLTLADAAGAVIGAAYGRRKFRVFAGWKSAEGSLLVFFVSFLSVHLPLLLMTELGRAETLLIAVTFCFACWAVPFRIATAEYVRSLAGVVPIAFIFINRLRTH